MRRREMMRYVFAAKLAMLVLALSVLATGGSAQRAAAASPFAGLAGNWSGSGILTLSGGAKERVRCRAKYDVARSESQLTQDLRCASDSCKFDVKSDVSHNAGSISGRWLETTRNLTGNLSGRVTGSKIDARIEGLVFAALLTITLRGNRQTIELRAPGSQISEVLINLRRR